MSEIEIRKAFYQFYSGINEMLNKGNLTLLEEIWSHADDVVNVSPFGTREIGWNEIRKLLETIATMEMGGRVEPRDLVIRVFGDLGYAFCIQRCEHLNAEGQRVDEDIRATSIFRREDGKWRLIYHHADFSPVLEKAYKEFPMRVEVATD